MKNKGNTGGNENHFNEKSENDHRKKDATEPLPENIDNDTQDQEGNKNKKEEEIISTDPVIETIMEYDHNEIHESLSEHSETMSKDMETSHQEINNNKDTTGVNNETTQETINDNRPTVILEPVSYTHLDVYKRQT